MQDKTNLYNNADSFSMAFDEAWKKQQLHSKEVVEKEDRLKAVLSLIKDHPFIISSYSEALKVAKFRIRLLDLN